MIGVDRTIGMNVETRLLPAGSLGFQHTIQGCGCVLSQVKAGRDGSVPGNHHVVTILVDHPYGNPIEQVTILLKDECLRPFKDNC